jgi:hypothetical protein
VCACALVRRLRKSARLRSAQQKAKSYADTLAKESAATLAEQASPLAKLKREREARAGQL